MTTIDRRRFLVVGLATAGTLAAGALATGGCSSTGASSTWQDAFGDALPGVREVGQQGMASGVVPTLDDALTHLPAERVDVRVDGDGEITAIEVADKRAFLDATQQLVTADRERSDFVSLSDYPLTPTEVSLAVLVVLSDDLA